MKMRKNICVTKQSLVNAVLNTYDNSHFYVGESLDETADFRNGLTQNQSCVFTKSGLLELINEKAGDEIPRMPEFPDKLVICPSFYVYSKSINENQIYHTTPPDGYIHMSDQYNANHDVYMKLDKDHKVISFVLGDKEKTLKLVEHTEYTYKLTGSTLLCSTVDDLERFINDIFWNPRMIIVGRRALKIKDAV